MAENKSSIMIDLDDPRTANIADVISNKTSKSILKELSNEELSESELSRRLGIAMNTVGYNIKKLGEAGLIEKTKSLWSVKGKKVYKYRISNKRIIISPRKILGGIVPSIIGSFLIAFIIKIFWSGRNTKELVSEKSFSEGVSIAVDEASIKAPEVVIPEVASRANLCADLWIWFLLGALTALFILVIYNWRFRK